MGHSWHRDDLPDEVSITAVGWVRAIVRGTLIAFILSTGLGLLLIVRVVERWIWGQRRPWTPFITQTVCQICLIILGIKRSVHGELMVHPGAVVANHSSWLDIFVLNASKRVYFVSKSEVESWHGIGWLAKATGTLFIRRLRQDARAQKQQFEDRLKAGHKLLFFPEGTSTDGSLVLDFKSTLFAAFFAPDLRETMWVQPVGVSYRTPSGQESRFYGWWGDMEFGPHALNVLATSARGGSVDVVFCPPLRVVDFPDRKALAKACETAVRSGTHSVS